MATKNIQGKLSYIQTNLKAHKGQFNSFGKYNYRNCEDILEALKPFLETVGASIVITDELVIVGERYYVKATAQLIDSESSDKISTTAFAREDDSKKGMDLSQLTGSTSSYARKYALNGLFAIDDTKDSDTTNTHGNIAQPTTKPIAQKPTQVPVSQPKDVNNLICSECNVPIVEKVASYSNSKFGKSLCFDCQKKQ